MTVTQPGSELGQTGSGMVPLPLTVLQVPTVGSHDEEP